MTANTKLLMIRIIHTLIWLLFNIVIFYVLYAAITGEIDCRLWISLALIAGEATVLLLFKMSCPLTVLARRYSDSQKANFDIFLPEWLARHNKLIYSLIVFASLAILAFRIAGPGF